jgi:hypothetical protein
MEQDPHLICSHVFFTNLLTRLLYKKERNSRMVGHFFEANRLVFIYKGYIPMDTLNEE